MEFTPITIIFDGVWDERDIYSNYQTTSIELSYGTTISGFTDLIANTLNVGESFKVAGIFHYKDGHEKRKSYALTEDRDVHMIYNGFSSSMYVDCCILAVIEPLHTELYNMSTPTSPVVVKVGLTFTSKDEMKKALGNLALTRSFQFITPKSNTKQYKIRCTHETCGWKVRASTYRGSDIWIIRKFIDVHTCPVDVVMNDQLQATPLIISGIAESLIRTTKKGTCTPGDLMKHVQKKYDVHIRYYKAMNGKEKALEGMRGRPEDSYAFLSKFAAKIIEKNPGSYTSQEVDDDGRFKYFFYSLAASIQGCTHCLPAISVDGASLKNKFADTLITACTFDSNSSIYPLGFAVVDSENDESWAWFFRNLKACFGDNKDLMIVSDRHSSIENAFNRVYSEAHQAICIFHLMKNIKLGHNSEAFMNSYFSCAKAYTPEDYEYHIRHLEQMCPNIRAKLEEAGPHRWARAFSVKNRYVLMTTNVSESLNKHLKDARELPIITLLEEVRNFMQRWFFERRNDADYEVQDISRRCADLLRGNLAESRSMDIEPVDNSLHNIHDGRKQYVVSLSERTCTCKQWQLDLIPCSHACRVISYKSLNLHSFVHEFFKTSTLRKLYRGNIYPIGMSHHSLADVDGGNELVQPPKVKRPVGRPRKSRIRSYIETTSKVKCGRCGRLGHNKRTCKNPI